MSCEELRRYARLMELVAPVHREPEQCLALAREARKRLLGRALAKTPNGNGAAAWTP